MCHISLQRYISPPPINSTDKIIIDVSADIMSILDINEISSIFQVLFQQEFQSIKRPMQVQFFLHLTWQDSRLKFYNLKDDTGLNALSPQVTTKTIRFMTIFIMSNPSSSPFCSCHIVNCLLTGEGDLVDPGADV